MRTRTTPNTDTFHAVKVKGYSQNFRPEKKPAQVFQKHFVLRLRKQMKTAAK